MRISQASFFTRAQGHKVQPAVASGLQVGYWIEWLWKWPCSWVEPLGQDNIFTVNSLCQCYFSSIRCYVVWNIKNRASSKLPWQMHPQGSLCSARRVWMPCIRGCAGSTEDTKWSQAVSLISCVVGDSPGFQGQATVQFRSYLRFPETVC